MDKAEALLKLQPINQEHLLKFYDTLTENEKSLLLNQIDELDVEIFKKQQALLFVKDSQIDENYEPLEDVVHADDLDDKIGQKLLSEGKFGCLIVAGGQGTRLQYDKAKGTFPVSSVKKKSLFQIFAEKTLAAGKMSRQMLPLAIMTSNENESEIKDFLKNNHYFGLNPLQLSFFSQKSLSLLDLQGNLFLENPYTISKGPDGNGTSLELFVSSGIYEEWLKKGVEFVNYVLIDNPLADPFDAKLLDYQSRKKAEIVIKCVKRDQAIENVGVLVKRSGFLSVIEYSEMTDFKRFVKDESGRLKFMYANISLFSFSMNFISKIANRDDPLPYHKALKKVAYFDFDSKTTKKPDFPNGWKFEKFIFDVLPFAEKVEVIEYWRKNCFSPLKNLVGDHTLESVQRQMELLDYETICQITGRRDPILKPFEIAQEFYYPTDELLEKWKGKEIPQTHYIKE